MLQADTTMLDKDQATELVRAVMGAGLTVTGVRRLHGGTINSVLELTTDGEPRQAVAKVCAQPGRTAFDWEVRTLTWFRANTEFPVPEPFGSDSTGRITGGSFVLMERLPGDSLHALSLTPAERDAVDRDIARHVAGLHSHTRDTYGSAMKPAEEGWTRWLDRYGPRIRAAFEWVADRLSPAARRTAQRVLDRLEDLVPEGGRPTLAHNDLWAANIIVEQPPGEAPRVSGFIDVIEDDIGSADYVDAEYELGYMLAFKTVGATFLEHYGRRHPLREGFQVRRRIYGLCTMMQHMHWVGAPMFTSGAERLARELADC